MWPATTKFLVVDDMTTMRKVVITALSSLGYTDIIEAKDGAEAWDKIQKMISSNTMVDCVISDWNMPNMKGIDLLKNVRATQQISALPFILLTAETEKSQVLEAARAGVSDYIIKPFKKEELAEKLGKVHAKVQRAA